MSGEIVNLRLARKRRDRAMKEQEAAQNRHLHGETKAERERKRLLADQAAQRLDAHRLDPRQGEGAASDD